MREFVRSLRTSHALLIGGMALWGVIELVALNRPHPVPLREAGPT